MIVSAGCTDFLSLGVSLLDFAFFAHPPTTGVAFVAVGTTLTWPFNLVIASVAHRAVEVRGNVAFGAGSGSKAGHSLTIDLVKVQSGQMRKYLWLVLFFVRCCVCFVRED